MLLTVSQLLLAIASAAGGVSNPTVQKWLSIAASLLQQGEQARADVEALTAQVQTMVDENREPTQAEWDDLAARSDAAHDIIQNWTP